MVQLKHKITGKIHQMNEKQYNKMTDLGQTFENYTRVIDTKKIVLEIETELESKLEAKINDIPNDIPTENINKTDESFNKPIKKKNNDL